MEKHNRCIGNHRNQKEEILPEHIDYDNHCLSEVENESRVKAGEEKLIKKKILLEHGKQSTNRYWKFNLTYTKWRATAFHQTDTTVNIQLLEDILNQSIDDFDDVSNLELINDIDHHRIHLSRKQW